MQKCFIWSYLTKKNWDLTWFDHNELGFHQDQDIVYPTENMFVWWVIADLLDDSWSMMVDILHLLDNSGVSTWNGAKLSTWSFF